MMLRRTLLLATLLAPAAARAATEPAAAPLEAFGTALIAAMKAGSSQSFDQRAAALRPAIQAAFNLPTILARSVGLEYESYTAAQKSALLAAFTDFTVATWTANFNHWDGEAFRVLPQIRKIGAEEVVPTEIGVPGKKGTALDFVMQQGAAGWQAVDILLDGTISRVAVQRSDFRSVLVSGGPDALITSLKRKAEQLATGGAG